MSSSKDSCDLVKAVRFYIDKIVSDPTIGGIYTYIILF